MTPLEQMLHQYDLLPSLYQKLIAGGIVALATWLIALVFTRIAKPLSTKMLLSTKQLPKKFRKRRQIHLLFRYAIHRDFIRAKDLRYSIDGVFYLISASLNYFLYACMIMLFYFSIISFTNGNILGLCAAILSMVLTKKPNCGLRARQRKRLKV